MLAKASVHTGLTSADVAWRLAHGEGNEYHVKTVRSYWEIVRDNVFNLFNIVLATLLVVMLFQHDFTNIILAGIAVFANTLLGLIQEIKARRSLDRLAALVEKEARVWRDGKLLKVQLAQLVKDDVLPVEPGDSIVVDGRVLQAASLEMNASLLTGESESVTKAANDMLWSGSFCTAGSGLMVATGVGANSTVNKLAHTAKAYKISLTPTQTQINLLVKLCVAAMLILGPMLIIGGVVNHLPSLEIAHNTVVLVSSLVAQGMVLSITLSLLLGAVRISQHNTLVQRINAIELLAHADVLCFDKTGTLTQNRLSVQEIVPLESVMIQAVQAQLRCYLANLSHLNSTASALATYIGSKEATEQPENNCREIPFTSERKWGAVTLPTHTLLLGAPERLLVAGKHREILNRACDIAAAGARVLVFARCAPLPENGKLDSIAECEPIALIVLNDQLRSNIRETLESFYMQQVDLKVISGDSVETVRTIAARCGIRAMSAYTGDQLEAMSVSQFDSTVRTANVFARIGPNTKQKIIASLNRQGFLTAMIGDGVNDVPALKEANVAIAMNDGAQIAKDVADMVLLDNALSTLPLAFAEGQRITQKIYSTTRLFLVKNFCVILLILCASFMMLPFPLTPVQISWLTFGIVNVPAALITFGILRPIALESFRREAVENVVAAFAGAVGGLFVYGALTLLLSSTSSFNSIIGTQSLTFVRDAARSGLFLFLALFGTVIFWQLHGVDLLRLQTIPEHPREIAVGIGLLLITVVPAFVLASLFNFVAQPVFWPLLTISVIVAVVGRRLGYLAVHNLSNQISNTTF